MNTPHTWTFKEGPILFITAEPGRIIIAGKGTEITLTGKGESNWAGLILMAQGRHELSRALLEAYRIAWPEPIVPPNSITIGLNIDIVEVAE